MVGVAQSGPGRGHLEGKAYQVGDKSYHGDADFRIIGGWRVGSDFFREVGDTEGCRRKFKIIYMLKSNIIVIANTRKRRKYIVLQPSGDSPSCCPTCVF